MTGGIYCAIYDFGLFPYALGDVLTWNVQTAIRCEELGRKHVDIYICVDGRQPPNVFQKDLITADNCELFFNEVFGAFGTHPRPGNIFLYRRRDEMVKRLREVCRGDAANSEDLAEYERALADYQRALTTRGDGLALMMKYFTKSIHSHERINAYAAAHGRIPLLRPSMGCEPDVTGLITKRFPGSRIVAIQIRLRRLDAGYGAANTYWRDSDFLEWYEFLKEAEKIHPNVQFVAVGRLQEKPLELLKLPNVTSLRVLGLGLGHELSLILKSDLFIGTSSGFAAMAFFSEVPYFITKMNHTACDAYQIEQGAEHLPFASEQQNLVYEPETAELLMKLLKQGLQNMAPHSNTPDLPSGEAIDVRSWEWESYQWLFPGATTSRFFTDSNYSDKETAFLVWPKVADANSARRKDSKDLAWTTLSRIEAAFPRMCKKFPEFLQLRARLAAERNERRIQRGCEADLGQLLGQRRGFAEFLRMLKRYWHWSFPSRMRAWQRFKAICKNRIPGGIMRILLRPTHERGG